MKSLLIYYLPYMLMLRERGVLWLAQCFFHKEELCCLSGQTLVTASGDSIPPFNWVKGEIIGILRGLSGNDDHLSMMWQGSSKTCDRCLRIMYST